MEGKKKRGRKPKATITGIGDIIEIAAKPVAEAIGLEEDCQGCNKRKKALNKLWSFYRKPTEEELEFLKGVFSWYKGLPISADKVNDIIRCEDIWIRLSKTTTAPCRHCGATHQNNYMDKLREVYENYIE